MKHFYSFLRMYDISYYEGGNKMKNRLTKSTTNRSVNGVCGGIAECYGLSSFAVRLIFVFLPFSLLIYIYLSNTLPDEPRSLY